VNGGTNGRSKEFGVGSILRRKMFPKPSSESKTCSARNDSLELDCTRSSHFGTSATLQTIRTSDIQKRQFLFPKRSAERGYSGFGA